MSWKKRVLLFKDKEPLTVLTDDRLGYDGYAAESNRVNRAVAAGKLNTCTDYYFQNYIVLRLMDN